MKRLRALGALVALACVVAVLSGTAPAASTTPPAEGGRSVRPIVRSDGVEGRMDTYASQISDTYIWDLEIVGTTIYAAGTFTKVVDAGGSWPRIDQPFLAAFDTRTGQWDDDWRPRVNRPAFALDVLPSGSIVVGGEFTQANGALAEGIVALDPDTGATDSDFSAGVRRPNSDRQAVVRDLDVRGNRLYAVGNFGQAYGGGGAPLSVDKAVRFFTSTGLLDRNWHPRLAGATAYAVAVSSDGRRVHLGGEFSSANGGRGTSQLATVNARNGALVRGWDHGSHAPFFPVWPVGGVVLDLAVYRNSLYAVGAEHFWERRDSRSGRKIHYQRITNDAQTVEVFGTRVIVGCHCYHRDPAHQIWEINAQTGRTMPGRTGALRSGDGTWASAMAPDGCTWLGGDFMEATAVVGLGRGSFWVGRLARICPPGVQAPTESTPAGPVNPPWWSPRG